MDILALYRQAGALLEGHFLLRSGRHSPTFLQSTTLMQHPLLAEQVAQALADQFRQQRIGFVIGPAMGGVVLAFLVARALGARALFAEKRPQGGMEVREGLEIAQGEPFLAVEDVLTTGGSVLQAIEAAQRRGGVCVGVGALIDRSQGQAQLGVPLRSVTQLEVASYQPDQCPLCQAGQPLQEV
jgi:orotate phosphoribosyltransferase